MSEHLKAVGMMASTVPQDRFPELVAWMFPLFGHDDRENMTRIWQMVMPPPQFEHAKQVIQKAIGSDWAELTRRIPPLAWVASVPHSCCSGVAADAPIVRRRVMGRARNAG